MLQSSLQQSQPLALHVLEIGLRYAAVPEDREAVSRAATDKTGQPVVVQNVPLIQRAEVQVEAWSPGVFTF